MKTKNWWKNFFEPITGEVMFKSRQGRPTRLEVAQVLKQFGRRKNLKILDLCCGVGRHSLEFARKGHEVTGLDFSSPYLREAKKQARQRKLPVRFVKGDMKKASQVVGENSFDLVTSLFNSFGYFDKRSDDFRTLQEVNRTLKMGGYFVLNTINGSGARHRFRAPSAHGYELGPQLFVLDRASLDAEKMRMEALWTIIDLRPKKAVVVRKPFAQNVYTHKDLKAMLKKAGFRVVKTWGVLQGGAFDEKTSWHQTILAQKRASL